MSSESENNTLNRLLGSQKQTAQEIKEIPYQPTVYAIPKDHWKLMLSQLGQQTEFQEKLYQVMKRMPTAQGMVNCINSTMQESEQTITRQNSQVSWQQKEEERILRESIEAMPERCRPKPDPFLEQREKEIMKYRKMTDPYEMPLPDEEEEFDIKMDM